MSKADQQLNSTGQGNSPDWIYRVIAALIIASILLVCLVLSRISAFLFSHFGFTPS